MLKISYTWRLRLYYAAGLVGTLALGLIAGTVSRLDDPGEYFWLVFAGLLLLAAGLFSFVYSWWRALDDVQKAGQTSSWYWGGTKGALVIWVAWRVRGMGPTE